jgi:hypothetical protein
MLPNLQQMMACTGPSSQEDKKLGEEVVLLVEEEKGIRRAKFFNNSKEIIFCPVIVLSRALPTGED